MLHLLSLLVCVIGGVIYCVTNKKGAELGRLAFGIGLFVFLVRAGAEAAAWLLR